MVFNVEFKASFKTLCYFEFIFGGIWTVNNIYKILLVIKDYFITFRNFLEFVIFFFHVINKEFTLFIVSE